jgi:gluconolactonase
MQSPLNDPGPNFLSLAATYDGKRFNSPNDAVYRSNGDLYFTDPPYGLPEQADDPAKELPFQGVYKLDTNGKVTLLTSEFSRPNGIAFSPDESKLYVANSDPQHAIWKVFDVSADGTLANGREFFDATSMVGTEKGLPDGLKVSRKGTLFATGPGGVFLFDATGAMLGKIKTGEATSNCALNSDESYLYITADSYLLRVALQR